MQDKLFKFIENRYQDNIRAHLTFEATKGDHVPFPESLQARLAESLQAEGVKSLYCHQADAFARISRDEDSVIVSSTASGKTLSFLLPILNEYLMSPSPFTVFFLYPTKALSRDQEGTIGRLMEQTMGSRMVGTFDGDTPREERVRLQNSADFILSNPDMLHSGILPNHNRKWRNFLSRLRYIVVDEVHLYRGAYGSHVANVFKRLIRICQQHGSQPSYVCSSATSGNPGQHVEALFGRPFSVIEKDGSPRPGRDIFLINPSMSKGHGSSSYRKGTGSVSVSILREAAKLGVRTICFCRARQEVERLYKAVIDADRNLSKVIQPYRGGLLPNERRDLEKKLFSGKLKVIISTNALELGIDIGDLDLCILSGHPGSMASFWQQAGRVGRKGRRGVIVFIAKDTPVDQYMVHHPEFISQSPIEQAWLNANNPYILLQHLPCAAYEQPLDEVEEPLYDRSTYPEALKVLQDDKTLDQQSGKYKYALRDYPAMGVNLRGMTDYNVDIYCGSEIIGEIDPIGARGSLYKDAIYQHLGRKYMSMDLDLEKKLCRVEPVVVDYYTEAVWENRVHMTEIIDQKQQHSATLIFGEIHSNRQPKLYKKIRERSFENVGYGPITLEPFEYDTTGFCCLTSKSWEETLGEKDKRFVGAAMVGLSYILKRTAPSLCMGDRSDIITDVALAEYEGKQWKSALYLYDAIEGGVGFGEKIYDAFSQVLEICLQIINECECESGCPACVAPTPPGVESEELMELLVESNGAVECTKSVLKNLLSGEVCVPEIVLEKKTVEKCVEVEAEDPEMLKMRDRLQRASRMLTNKKKRRH